MTELTQTCTIEKCKGTYRAKGYCDRHYKKWRRGELPHSRYETCNQEGCRKKWFERGYCEEHAKTHFGKKGEGAPASIAPAAAEPKAEAKTEAKKEEKTKAPDPAPAA